MKTSPPGKSTALIAYAPFVGFLIAYFINRDEDHEFARWHIKNMFGLTLFFIVSLVVQSQINIAIGDVLWLVCVVIWLICWCSAFFNKKIGIPIVSEKFQQWFTFLN